MIRPPHLGLLALALGSAALAQVRPVPGDGDPHLQTVEYNAGQIVQLRGAPGFQLMVELSPDEAVQSVALGDSAAWQVSINKAGDRLFLKPAQGEVTTNMTVVTSVRVYNFDLYAQSSPSPDMPYTVQFRYAAAQQSAHQVNSVPELEASGRKIGYRISGDRLLRPASISSDGQRTYISWPKEAPLPAIYAPDASGNDVLLNGMMGTDDVYVVGGTPKRMTFRIDRSIARAERVTKRK